MSKLLKELGRESAQRSAVVVLLSCASLSAPSLRRAKG